VLVEPSPMSVPWSPWMINPDGLVESFAAEHTAWKVSYSNTAIPEVSTPL
jgi:hypothetical protein